MQDARKYLDPQVLSKLANLELVAQFAVEGFFSGLHPSPFHGFSVEYSDHRAYQPGDELKFLDWKAYGRSDKLYIKQFQQETNVSTQILLDSSNSMTFKGSGAISKFDYACFTAAALSYLMLKQSDAVGLTVFSDTIRKRIPAKSRRTHLHTILRALGNSRPSGQTHLAQILHNIAETTNRKGLIVLISDLLDDTDEIINGLGHLRYLKHDVIVFHVLDHQELELDYDGLVRFEDLESNMTLRTYPQSIRGAYKERLEAFLDDVKKTCGNTRIDYQLIDTSTPLNTALTAYLTKRRRLF